MRRSLPSALLCASACGALALGGCGRVTSGTSSQTARLEPDAAPTAPGTIASPPTKIASQPVAQTSRSVPRRPMIKWEPIPFPASRKREMAEYAERHYGIDTYRLVDPRVIVEHYTESPDFRSTYEVFAPDHPDSELHELPNTCAHFVVDRNAAIHQLTPLTIMCRHTVGLNYTAIGIENVGYDDGEILEDRAEMKASLDLTRWLRCKYGISVANVIGHNESLSSPFHHEDVPSLRTQTHEDWKRPDMDVYRTRLRRLPCS